MNQLDFLEKYKQFSSYATNKLSSLMGEKVVTELKSRRMIIMLTFLAVLFGLIFGYHIIKGYLINRYLKNAAEPAISVSTIKAGYQDWQPNFKASANLRAVQGVEVTAEIAGMVRAILFAPGARVKAGDVLVKLNADADIAELHVQEAAADLAKVVLDRDTKQYAVQAISKATLDADTADLKGKLAQVAQQTATVAKKTITAPFAGRLGISAVNLGQYVNPGDKVVTLQSLDPIYVDFFVPQQSLSQIAVNQKVLLTTDAFPDEIFKGKITTINPIADSETRNIEVEALISNPKYKLLPGMYGRVEVDIGDTKKYLTLPQAAISFNPYGELVYIIKETGKDKKGEPILKATQSFVTVGEMRGDQITVLKGVQEGDIIVTSGQLKLKNGSRVVINNAIEPADNPSTHVDNN